MAESLREFHDRVDGFTGDSLPKDGSLITNPNLAAKIDPSGRMLPFFGNTMIYDLSPQSKLAIAERQLQLYRRVGYALAEPVKPATFHITLHDLLSSPDHEAIKRRMSAMRIHAKMQMQMARMTPMPWIKLRSTRVFSMVNTSVVLGFEPVTEQDCHLLMSLYEQFHDLVPLSWGLTPHVTLAYYKPGEYHQDTIDALQQAINDADALPPVEVELSMNDLLYAEFSDMNTYT